MYMHSENTREGQPTQHLKEQLDQLLSTQTTGLAALFYE